ncbi:MAG: hypothetical protein HC848_01620 [Limnobacter sp.]|nr:hypothetical protein [Limnobacter sp.]
MNRIALLTSNSARHRWVAALLAEVAELVCVISEEKPAQNTAATHHDAQEMRNHFEARQAAEAYWFKDAPAQFSHIATQAHRYSWQGSNTAEAFALLQATNPDRVFLFGSSIIRDPLLAFFQGRIVNMHLGLSPYYRGSATNYWPLVDGLPECVGVTVHHATPVVDGGGILAQGRPYTEATDNAHDMGCKAILAGAALLQHFAKWQGPLPEGIGQTGKGKLCKRSDFSIESLIALETQLKHGLLKEYLAAKPVRDARYPIVQV